jgi:hypothetical protein
MYFATVASLTVIPSFKSSPWMRGAPHRGFASDMVRIRVRSSVATVGRPRRRLFQVQMRRKPRRFHARTVSGFTMTTVRQSRHRRDNHTQSTRSPGVRRTRRGRDRSSTLELVSQGEDLEVQPGPRSDRRAQREEQRNDYGRHRPAAYLSRAATSMNAATMEFSLGTSCEHRTIECSVRPEIIVRWHVASYIAGTARLAR